MDLAVPWVLGDQVGHTKRKDLISQSWLVIFLIKTSAIHLSSEKFRHQEARQCLDSYFLWWLKNAKKMRTKCDFFFFPLCILWDGRLCLSVLSECCTKLIQLPCGSTYWSKLIFYCCEYWTTIKCEEQRLIYVGRNYCPQTVNLTTCGKNTIHRWYWNTSNTIYEVFV